MIRRVSARGNKVRIDWDQEDHDLFFRHGLQMLADEHFGGRRKVVVLPIDAVKLDKKARVVRVGKGFADVCVELAFNQCLWDHIDRVKGDERHADVRKWAVKDLDEMTKTELLVNGLGPTLGGVKRPHVPPRPMTIGPESLVHKAKDAGSPATWCGVGRPRHTALKWGEVSCGKCRRRANPDDWVKGGLA